jgi:hypothetical protein
MQLRAYVLLAVTVLPVPFGGRSTAEGGAPVEIFWVNLPHGSLKYRHAESGGAAVPSRVVVSWTDPNSGARRARGCAIRALDWDAASSTATCQATLVVPSGIPLRVAAVEGPVHRVTVTHEREFLVYGDALAGNTFTLRADGTAH